MRQGDPEYVKYAWPQRVDKEIHNLEGLIKGITVDRKVTEGESTALNEWCNRHKIVSSKHPFNELLPRISAALVDEVLDQEERDDILWLCQRFSTPNVYFSAITSDMQRLHGLLAGIVADGVIEKAELEGLSVWLDRHVELRGNWPFDEIDSIIMSVLADGVIDEQEHKSLVQFCSEFLSYTSNLILETPVQEELMRDGVCAACPEIRFQDSVFCFTGQPKGRSKAELAALAEDFGGSVAKNMRRDVDYLVIGSEGSKCWAFSCYGRKVEAAMKLRRVGLGIMLVHEFDFLDPVEDHR